MTKRWLQQQPSSLPESGLRAPRASGVRRNVWSDALTVIATRCFEAAEKPDAAAADEHAAITRSPAAASLAFTGIKGDL
jgi:hypothetical protein